MRSAGNPRACPEQKPRIDSAFRWRRLLEEGVYATIEELASAEKINVSYVSRVLRLTLLSPAVVEAILDGRSQPELTLARLFRPLPVEWAEQETRSAPAG